MGLSATTGWASDVPTCEVEGATAAWIGEGEPASDIATSDSFLERSTVAALGQKHVTSFVVSESGSYRIEAVGGMGTDPIVEILGTNGVAIAMDDDSGGNGAARIETDLGPGTYCAHTTGYNGGVVVATVRVSRAEHEPLTEGGSEGMIEGCELEGALTLTLSPSADGAFEPVTHEAAANTQGNYRVTLPADAAISISANSDAADPTIALFDADGEMIAENDDWEGLNSLITVEEPLLAGDYCLRVAALDDGDSPIAVTVGEYDPIAAMADKYSDAEVMPPLDGSAYPVASLGTLNGLLMQEVQMSDDALWYSIDVATAGMIVVEALASGSADPMLSLYDAQGNQIAQNDDKMGGDLSSFVAARVQPGTYGLALTSVSDEAQGSVRLLAEPYVRAQ